ncbi:uncharacterized protein ACN427_013835 isoform 2-T2 [Glossina fuscipes fuscipes]
MYAITWDVQPRLKSLHKDTFYPDVDDSASIRGANKKKVLNGQHRNLVSNEEDTETDEYPKELPVVENEEDINDEFHQLLSKTESYRKPSYKGNEKASISTSHFKCVENVTLSNNTQSFFLSRASNKRFETFACLITL